MMKRFNYWCVVLCAALGIGALAGAVDALFGRVLLWITAFRDAHVWMLAPFLALAGLAIVFLYAKSAALAKGMGLVFDAARNREAQIPAVLIPTGDGVHLAHPSLWRQRRTGRGSGADGRCHWT